MKDQIITQTDPSKSPEMHVIGDTLVGVQLSEIIRRLKAGDGQPDLSDTQLKVGTERIISIRASTTGAVGGLRTYLHEGIGDGYQDMVDVCPGFVMSITDACYKKAYRYTFPPEQLLKIRSLCSGTISTPNSNLHTTEGTAHIQFAETGAQTSYVVHPGTRLQMVGIIITPEALHNLSLVNDMLPVSMTSLLGSTGDKIELLPINSCVKSVRIAREIIESRKTIPHELRLTYIRGKAQELFCEAILQVKPNIDHQGEGKPLNQADISLLREAKRILDCSLEDPPTIEQLSRLVGVNRTKLKSKFGDYFGETIHSYQTRVRMQEAERMLTETELQFTEISSRVGFKHPSNFTQVIKNYFGMGPKELRKCGSSK